MSNDKGNVSAVILAAGIAVAGWAAGNGLASARASDQYVTVRGVSEREARANLAIWPLHLVAAGNDLAVANSQLASSVTRIKQFLARNQIDTTQLALNGFSVTDALANQYGQGERAASRYVIKQTVLVRSTRPELVLAASQHLAELVNSGVVLSSGEEYGGGGPTFVFTDLSKVKPPMIAEATARAREAAEQFAHDSRSAVGGIRHATQGVFEIAGRDQAQGVSESSQMDKTIRVVTTVEYFLKN
jgi:hypothetical protein